MKQEEEVTEEGLKSLDARIAAMKADGTYAQWRRDLRAQADAYDNSLPGRLDAAFRSLRYWWDGVLNRYF